MKNYEFNIAEQHSGQRLDKVIPQLVEDISRSRVQALITEGAVSVDGVVLMSGKEKTKMGQSLRITIPDIVEADPTPQNIPLDIVFEDDHVLVINKPVGMVVHPGAGHHDQTLVNALLYHCGDSLSGIGGVKRPGIVHRLDKDTSGLMMVAKNDKAHQGLSAQLQDRSLKRTYHALCWGQVIPLVGVIDQPIGRHPKDRLKMSVRSHGGRDAITKYKTITHFGEDEAGISLVECSLMTGRTHQIRVHMQSLGAPLIGDQLYNAPLSKQKSMIKRGFKPDVQDVLQPLLLNFPRQALHAKAITFIHPETENVMEFNVEYPEDLQNLLVSLEKGIRIPK